MTTIEFLGVHLDVCPTSGGIWFDEGEFGRIRKAVERLPELEGMAQPQVESVPDRVHRPCPNCASPLYTYRFLYSTPVMLDGCETCNGMWVDEGELEAMAEALALSRMPPKLNEEAAIALAEMEQQSALTERRSKAVGWLFRIAMMPRYWRI